MHKIVYAVSEDYERLTGGWIYNERLLSELGRMGHTVERLVLPAGFPNPTPEAVRQTCELFAGLPDNTLVVADQICLGVLPDLATLHRQRLKLFMIVHHPIALEDETDEPAARRFAELERAALKSMLRVIVTSETTRRGLIEHYSVLPSNIVCAQPGVDKKVTAAGAAAGVPSLLSVGAVVPRKGHDILVAALARLRNIAWTATIVGNTTRNPDHVTAVERLVAQAGLSERVTFTGELSESRADLYWRAADVFVAASRHEGYGMAVAEALARGMPVVTTMAGAVGEWVSRDAALVVPTGDVTTLADALRSVLEDCGRRQQLRDGALAQRNVLAGWADTARIVSEALKQV